MSKRRITEQQKRRITESRSNLTNQNKGRVLAHFGKAAILWDEEHQKTVFCHKRQHLAVVVGDEVSWDETGVITDVLTRHNCLEKYDARGRAVPMAANIDQLIIVVAPLPPPQLTSLDRYLVLAEHHQITPLLVFNKEDLTDDAWRRYVAVYARLPYQLFQVSKKAPASLMPLKSALIGQVSLMVGQSGVGKSTLIQALVQDDDIVIGDLSKEGLLGKHTTTVSRWYFLAEGGAIVDSPGIRELKLPPLSRQELLSYFPDAKPFAGTCRFRNCAHTQETPGCALWAAVDQGKLSLLRLQSLLTIAEQ